MGSETIDIILQRRSCRRYYPDPLPEEHLKILADCLRWSPSAGNRQPWHFFLIKQNLLKKGLSRAAYGQTFLEEAPVVFVICALPERSANRYGQRGRELYVIQDTAAAVENLLLAATALGYGSCWVGAFSEEEVIRLLDLSVDWRPVALVPVGKAADTPQAPPRLPLKETLTVKE